MNARFWGVGFVVLMIAVAVALWTGVHRKPGDAAVSNAPRRESVNGDAAVTNRPPPAVVRVASSPVAVSAAPIEEAGHSIDSNDISAAILKHPELGLSPDEIQRMVRVYVDVVRRLKSYEASIATVDHKGPAENVIRIPAYLERGAQFREDLYREFDVLLGDRRGEAVRRELGAELEARNHGFGAVDQVLDVKLVRLDQQGIYYEITHSAAPIEVRTGGTVAKLELKSGKSVLPISNLGPYAALVQLFPVGE